MRGRSPSPDDGSSADTTAAADDAYGVGHDRQTTAAAGGDAGSPTVAVADIEGVGEALVGPTV